MRRTVVILALSLTFGLAQAQVVRFPAQVPVLKWPAAHHVYAAIVAGDWAEAKRRYDANPQDVADAMGAIAYWYTQYNPDVAYVKTNALLGGTWTIVYTYGPITYNDKSTFTAIQAGTSATTPWIATGFNKYGNAIAGGWGTNTNELMVMSPLTNGWDVYVFDYTGANTISGCYYFDYGQSNPFSAPCTPLSGFRSLARELFAAELADDRPKIDYIVTQPLTPLPTERERELLNLRNSLK